MDNLNEATPSTAAGEGQEAQPQVSLQEAAARVTAPQPETQQPAPEGSQEEAFFDATKVPEALKPSYLEMQKAFTQKTQEIAELKKVLAEYGDTSEVGTFLKQFSNPEGTIQWWVQVAKEMGLSETQLTDLFDSLEGEGEALANPLGQPDGLQPQGPSPDDPNRPVTMAELQQLFEQQQQQARMAEEDTQVDSLLKKLELPSPEIEEIVAHLASKEPYDLGYEERIARGHKKYQELVDSQVSNVLTTKQQLNQQAPAPLSGGSPAPVGESPESLGDASKAARAFLERTGS